MLQGSTLELTDESHSSSNEQNSNLNFNENDKKINPSLGGGHHKKFLGFTWRQWKFLLAFGVTNIFRAAAIIANAPFFSALAGRKGVSGTVTGLIFGTYDFTVLLTSPFYGNYIIPKLGAKLVFVLSSVFLGMHFVIYGLMEFVEDQTAFIALCFFIRFLGGMSDAGFYPAAFTVFTIESQKYVSTCIGIFELFFGVGAVLGPPLVGLVIDKSGFATVYVIMGLLVSIFGILTYVIVPKPKEASDFSFIKANWRKIWRLIRIPKSFVIFAQLLVCALSIGFITGSFQKHLKQFELSSFYVGTIFTISTFMYMISSPFWGIIVDKKRNYKLSIITAGIFLIFLGFCLVGPLPFFGTESPLWIILIGFGLHGIGVGCSIMATYPIALDAALEKNFHEKIDTFSAISSTYTATFALGNSIGPALSGLLFDHFGFRSSTYAVVILSFIIGVAQFAAFWPKRKSSNININIKT